MAFECSRRWIMLTVIASLWMSSVHSAPTLRYSSGCSVDMCDLINATNSSQNGNSSCSQPPPCYLFETSMNRSICGPQVICSLFDPCTSSRQCASNTSVCVLNTCCTLPICMPLALTTSCSMYTSNYRAVTSWSSRICSNATWADNSTLAISNYWNNSWFSFGDFFIDVYNNIFVVEGYRILKYAANNTSVPTVAAATSNSSTYQAQSIYADNNGTIYAAESWYSLPTYYYRVVKYSPSNGMSGLTVFGPVTCSSSLTSLCGCNGIFVDQTGVIYYSDTTNHRVIKFQQYASSATLVAGTSGTSGSMQNQLYNPAGIFVDSTGALYVADQNNYRVMKFNSGSTVGTVLFNTASYQTPTGLIVDNAGAVYIASSSNVYKWNPLSSSTNQIITSTFYNSGRIRMDSFGNIYTSGYMMSNIQRNNITANYC